MPSFKDYLLTYNPVSLWALDETSGLVAYDATGVKAGTYVNGPTFDQDPFFLDDTGRSVRFVKASSTLVEVPDDATHRGMTDFIIEAWFETAAISGNQVIVNKWGAGNIYDDYYQIYLNGSGNLVVTASTGVLGYFLGIYDAGITAGNWYHVVFVKRSGNFRTYLNGSLVYNDSGFSGAINNNVGQPLYIGKGVGFPNDSFDGWIDNVALYTGANVPSSDVDLDNWVTDHYGWGTTCVADFSADQTYGDVPLTVQFTDLSQGHPSPNTWSWDFGDETTDTTQNPSHVYNKAGIYTVSLTSSNGVDSDTETKTGYIDVEMVVNFFVSPTTEVFPFSTLQFYDDTKGEPTSWLWDFGDGATSTQKNPTHGYSLSGYYTVALTASNAQKSDSVTKVNYIHVNLVGVHQEINYIHVIGTLKTYDLAPPSNRYDLRYMIARGDARYNSLRNGIRVSIPSTGNTVGYSGFKRKNGPSLVFD
jgi:PKD repeat protein